MAGLLPGEGLGGKGPRIAGLWHDPSPPPGLVKGSRAATCSNVRGSPRVPRGPEGWAPPVVDPMLENPRSRNRHDDGPAAAGKGPWDTESVLTSAGPLPISR